MTAAELVRTLTASGATLARDGDRLILNAPVGVVSPEMAEQIRSLKGAILELLDSGAARPIDPFGAIPRVDGPVGELGLTQQRLWYLAALSPDSSVLNLPAAFRFRGPIDLNVLQRVIDEIVRRHSVLRSAIEIRDDVPVLVQSDAVPFPIEVVDLSDIPSEARRERLTELIDQSRDEPIPLDTAPLVKARLFRLAEDEHVLFWMPHHVIWDGWSFDVFLDELDALYSAFSRGRPSPLPDLPVQYRDYAPWHRALAEQGHEKQMAFWHSRLAGDLPVLEMATDHPRPAEMSFDGSRESLLLDPQLVASINTLAHEEEATSFMVLLAGFYALLHRYTGQSDLIVGSPIRARWHPDTEALLGMFVNTLLLRAEVEPQASFRDLLRHVRDVCVSSYDHQDTPFELLVEEFVTERSLSRTPLYQALFSYQNVSNRNASVGDLALDQLHVETSVAPTDLTVWLMESEDGVLGGVDYARALFEAETMQRFLEHYARLLRSAADDPDRSIASLEMMSDEERAALIGGLEPSERHAFATEDLQPLHELFECQVDFCPHAVAVEDVDGSVTYAELDALANGVAGELVGAGVGSEDPVGVMLGRTTTLLAALLGVFKAGAAYVPLEPDFPRKRRDFVADHAGVKVLVSDAATLAEATAPPVETLLMDDVTPRDERPPTTASTPETLAYVMYTSGSTGVPKGVEVEHGSAVNLLWSTRDAVGFGAGSRMLGVTTPSFDISVVDLFLPLITGGTLVLASRQQAGDGLLLARAISESNPDLMQATPATWRMLEASDWGGDPKLTVMSSGEELPPGLAAWLHPRVGTLINAYGPTETTIWSTMHEVTEVSGRVPIGRPVANTPVYVLDAHHQPVPQGVIGELFVGGVGVARGYRSAPELTAERFLRDPFSEVGARMYGTGDRVRINRDGLLEFYGRSDHQVQIRGYRIELGEVEAALHALEGVQSAVALEREISADDARLVAYTVFTPGAELTPSEMRRSLGAVLPRYMIPSLFVELAELPLTPNGKIDRKKLPEPVGRETRPIGFEAPASPAERMLSEIWREVLGIAEVGRHDNFFSLGGHSLLSMRVAAAVARTTGHEIDPRSMFFQTLAQIAAPIRLGEPAESSAAG